MLNPTEPNPSRQIPQLGFSADRIASAAQQLGVEVSMQETREWLLAMSAGERSGEIAQEAKTGIFGHRIALLDFDAQDLAYFRRLARRIRTEPDPQVESAIAIAGSAAQGKVQLFPGDNDYFERVNIHAPTLDAARATLARILRATAVRSFSEPDIVLVEVNFGVYPCPVRERGSLRAAGDSITWMPQDVAQGAISVQTPDGQPLRIEWEQALGGMGWTYLGWIVADREQGRISLASNMLDVTWQAPEGTLVSLDGAIDPFFQEIYLESTAMNLFNKIVRGTDADAKRAYVNTMRAQAYHYTHQDPNYGKASKRLYNLFRLTDQLEAAAYLRELFDEPGARLYQVPGLLEAADVALRDPQADIDRNTVLRQIELVMADVAEATEGTDEALILAQLRRAHDDVMCEPPGADWDKVLHSVRARCAEIVNEYFRIRLLGYPPVKAYVESLTE